MYKQEKWDADTNANREADIQEERANATIKYVCVWLPQSEQAENSSPIKPHSYIKYRVHLWKSQS